MLVCISYTIRDAYVYRIKSSTYETQWLGIFTMEFERGVPEVHEIVNTLRKETQGMGAESFFKGGRISLSFAKFLALRAFLSVPMTW